MKKNFDLFIKPTKKQKYGTNLVNIALYLAYDATADPYIFVDSWKCITVALQPIKIEIQNLTKNNDHVPLKLRYQYPYCSLF